IGMFQMTAIFQEQPRTVVILGAEELPPQPPLLNGQQFNSNWFRLSTDADKLRVLTDTNQVPSVPSSTAKSPSADADAEALARAQKMRQFLIRRVQVENQIASARESDRHVEKLRLENELHELSETLGTMFQASDVQVLIVIPADFKQNL